MTPKGKPWFPAIFSRDAASSGVSEGNPPTLGEVLLMLVTMFALHLLIVCKAGNFWDVAASWMDNPPYLAITAIIHHGRLLTGYLPRHFWGFPQAIAGVSSLLSIPDLWALVIISALASLATCALVHRLYGGWVAAVFIFINYQWLLISMEGGSEPLFMCLLYASFLAARSERWNLAALLAALSTVVRPVGVLALLCFAAVLVMRRKYRQLAMITLIGLEIGVLYILPLWIILGNPFANFTAYRPDWGAQGWPITYPFGALVSSSIAKLHNGDAWYRFSYFAVWLVAGLAGTVAIWLPRNRAKFSGPRLPEALFASIYMFFFLIYNYDLVVVFFSRFLIPIVPLLVFAFEDWIPRNRFVLWTAAVLTAVAASFGRVGLRNVLFLGPH